LNRARYDYGGFRADVNRPLINRAINKQYPPGSVIKPLILIAGLETGQTTPEEIIGCPPEAAPEEWPSGLAQTRSHRMGHDWRWEAEGGNIARNAIRGSCNIYFSLLADRIEPLTLQQRLFAVCYGQRLPLL